ncbi:complement C1q and tumor necrosis factor-related protein 9-like, partial [Boleophthalmus pectinirostris]|uniref:complement C1q and tumor necrosis factor-related protein 9-like n=1 Tax=Boleophthalmus pectinirostris TaxID=150288 RepID=UPI0024300F47
LNESVKHIDHCLLLGPLPEPTDGKTVDPAYPKKEVIAFTAKLNIAHSTPYHRGVLKLVDVVTNEGNGYSPETGHFVCPLKGLYFFTVHMSVAGRAHCEIYKNGESVTTLYDTSHPHDCPQVATISTVVELKEKDTVWVNLWGHGRHEIIATEDNDTVFVGFYLG